MDIYFLCYLACHLLNASNSFLYNDIRNTQSINNTKQSSSISRSFNTKFTYLFTYLGEQVAQ